MIVFFSPLEDDNLFALHLNCLVWHCGTVSSAVASEPRDRCDLILSLGYCPCKLPHDRVGFPFPPKPC